MTTLRSEVFKGFVYWGQPVPHSFLFTEAEAREVCWPADKPVHVRAARCKTRFGAASETMLIHDVVSAASFVHDGAVMYAARWRCGRGALKPIFIAEPGDQAAHCDLCVVLRDIVPGVYRCFAADGSLVYVGSSARPSLRLRQHEKAAWWPLVDRFEIERFDTITQARTAEATAIRNENPAYNRLLRARKQLHETAA